MDEIKKTEHQAVTVVLYNESDDMVDVSDNSDVDEKKETVTTVVLYNDSDDMVDVIIRAGMDKVSKNIKSDDVVRISENIVNGRNKRPRIKWIKKQNGRIK